MTQKQWAYLSDFKKQFRTKCTNWAIYSDQLLTLQKNAGLKDTPLYPIENPLVYNTDLDNFSPDSEIKLIIIGDNPGKNEQLSVNKKYLTGQAGKLGDHFFKNNQSLAIDFRKNVLILNKTPVHTAKTKHLKYLSQNGSAEIKKLLQDSQIWMAEKTAELHKNFCSEKNAVQPFLWLIGYSEIKKKGIFEEYKRVLEKSYLLENTKDFTDCWNKVLVFQHFSMNRFSIDLNKYMQINPQENIETALLKLGTFHKDKIFNKN